MAQQHTKETHHSFCTLKIQANNANVLSKISALENNRQVLTNDEIISTSIQNVTTRHQEREEYRQRIGTTK